MAEISKIEWTDATWNPVRGCTRVSEGCRGCYAERDAARFSQPGQWGHGFAENKNGEARWTGQVALIPHMLDLPLRWKTPRKIFVNSTSDLFHEALADAAIDRVFAVMALCPQHTFQVLTKRPERMREYFLKRRFLDVHPLEDRGDAISAAMNEIAPQHWCKRELQDYTEEGLPLANIWLGTSCEDQPTFDDRAAYLRSTPAAVRFLSLEPLLGAIDGCGFAGIDWVIVGGESGPKARPMHPDWARSIRDQCAAAGVAFFFKQWGAWGATANIGFGDTPNAKTHVFRTGRTFDTLGGPVPYGIEMRRVGKKRAGRLLDGVEHSAMP